MYDMIQNYKNIHAFQAYEHLGVAVQQCVVYIPTLLIPNFLEFSWSCGEPQYQYKLIASNFCCSMANKYSGSNK